MIANDLRTIRLLAKNKRTQFFRGTEGMSNVRHQTLYGLKVHCEHLYLKN